jgi:pimeloyl-ACP methyl ester carboxylesterase
MHTFQHNGHTLTWDEYSTGEHTLLFIHGWSVGRLSWETIIQPYTHLGRCVTIDLPGHYPAQSPAAYTSLSQQELIELETTAIKHICGDAPVTLIGHSAGGLVALAVAAQLGQQVQRIITINSVIWGDFRGIVGLAQWLVRNNLFDTFKTLWNLTLLDSWTMMLGLSMFIHQQPRFWTNTFSWQSCQRAAEWYRKHSLEELTIFLHFLDTCDIRSLITDLQTPVLIIVGEKDPVIPPEQSYWLDDHLPNTALRILEQTGHIPQIETPITFQNVMLAWLEQTNTLPEQK